LAALPQEEDQIRTIAGYLLKNNAHFILKASSDVAEYAKAAVLSAFNDPSALVRTAAGQDIVAFLGVLEPRNWPDCLERLVGMLDDPNRQEVSLHVFEMCATPARAVTLRTYRCVMLCSEPSALRRLFGEVSCAIRQTTERILCDLPLGHAPSHIAAS